MSTHIFSATLVVLCLSVNGFASAFEDPNPPSLDSDRGAWRLMRQWTPVETSLYAQWIEQIYRAKRYGTPEQRVAQLARILTDPEMNLLLTEAWDAHGLNPQLDRDTMAVMHRILDCGKLTIALTGYYAYRRGLPWMITYVRSHDGSDIRTAAYNFPSGESSCLEYQTAHRFFSDAIQGFCTGNYRVDPNRRNSERSDTVPAALSREALRPGALFYQDGHVEILAGVDGFGELAFLDSTTASSRDIYPHNGMSAVTGITPRGDEDDRHPYSGCYRGFRLHRWPIAETNEAGEVTHIRRRTNAEMAAFGLSLEQYDRMRELTESGRIVEDGRAYDTFHDYLRNRLAAKDSVNPVEVLEVFAKRWRETLQRREKFVQEAWRHVREEGSIAFPQESTTATVFNGVGRWGDWSSAALDADLRADYFELVHRMALILRKAPEKPDYIKLSDVEYEAEKKPWFLAQRLADEKRRIFGQHAVQYTNSRGEPIRLTLLDVEERLYDLSFDPNHPPELRWGAEPGSTEAAGAPSMPTLLPGGQSVPMNDAYALEAYYRSLIHREPGQSYLQDMFTEGFPLMDRFDARMARWAAQRPVPPLVPRGWQWPGVAAGD